jgi:hypothetical protein
MPCNLPFKGDASFLEDEVSPLLSRKDSVHADRCTDSLFCEKKMARSNRGLERDSTFLKRKVYLLKDSDYKKLCSLMHGWSHLDQMQRGQCVRTKIAKNILPEFWFQITGADNVFIQGIFAILCEMPGDNEMNDRIAKDVPRTLQSVEVLRDSQVQALLSSVLRAYAVYDPRVGYCQVRRIYFKITRMTFFSFGRG